VASLQYWQAVSTRAQAAAAPERGGARLGRAALPLLGLFAGAALISGFTIWRGGAEFDEGVVLAAAARVANGELPYRDFLWPYGPAQPYALGAWFDLFGPSLMSWRVLRVLCDAAVATTVYALVRRDAPPWLALVAWLTAACAMAQPTSPTPFPFALLLVLLAYGAATRSRESILPARDLVAAGLLIGLAAAWRLDFALYGAAAVAVALLLRPGPSRARALALFAAPAAGLALLLYLPFAAAIGPADLYDELVGKSLREKEWWTLPFPFSYHGDLRAWPPGALAEDAKDVLGFYLPLLGLVGLGLALFAWLPSARREWRLAGLLVLAAGMVAYLLSRADEFHTTPLIVALALVLPACIALARRPRVLALACAVVLGLFLLHGVANRGKALLAPPELDTIDVAVADGAKAPPGEARAIERMVETVQGLVPPGEPIYVATLRSDLVPFNDPRVYVLTERPNAAEADFGLLARPGEQAAIVAALERERPRAVVRWLDPISVRREPNLRGEPTGVRILDRYLEREYRTLERQGEYEVLVPR